MYINYFKLYIKNKQNFKKELKDWKSRNDDAKVRIKKYDTSFQFFHNLFHFAAEQAETARLNEKALNDAEEAYRRHSSSIDDWLEGITPYASSEEAAEHHRKIQETTENDLKSHLKGPNEFTKTFIDRFLKVSYLFTANN